MPPATPATSDHRSAAIDGLRAIAALTVLAYHAWLYSLPKARAGHRDSLLDQVVHEFRLGLVLFFVLSGFLLFRPWVRSALARRATGPTRPGPRTGAFYLRRAARIGPGYYAALLGSIALLWPLASMPGLRLPPAEDLWLFGVFGQNFTEATVLKLNPPLWTLAVEVTFYLVLPLLGWLALRLPHAHRRAVQLVVPAAFLAAGVGWNWWLAGKGYGIAPTKILPAMAPYFALGMAAAVLVEGHELGRRAVLVLVLAGSALVVADAAWAANEALTGSHDLTLRIVRDVPAAAGFAAIIAAAAASTRRLPVLSWRPLALVGLVSYGLYLWHVPLLIWLRAHGLLPGDVYGAFAVVILPALAFATVSWLVLERPAQRWAQRVTRRPVGDRPDPPDRPDRPDAPDDDPAPTAPASAPA